MKNGNNTKKRNTTAQAVKPTRFTLTMPQAKSVAIAGTFNDWNPARGLMRSSGDGVWDITIPLPRGRHQYRFVVNGQWCDDPNAKDFESNPLGSRNAVVVV